MKLRGKLILSCAALAAVATTAFSTTFAWYITNSTVSASGVTAGTAAGGSDTLQISKDAVGWYSSVDVNIDVETLIPVQYGANGNTADGTYPTWNPTANAASGNSAASGAYCDFNLYFRNPNGASGSKVYLKQLTVTNATNGGLPYEKLLTGAGVLAAGYTAADVKQKNTYQMDLIRALDLEIVSKAIDVNVGDFVGAASDDSANKLANTAGDAVHVYGLDAYAGADDYIANTTNAHTYYNDFKGLTGNTAIDDEDKLTSITQLNLATAKTSAADSIELGGAAGYTYLKTTWRLFINGWDLACFDAIKGQSIQFSMVFDTFSATN